MTAETCEWCGGEVTAGTTCPRSLGCPTCGATAGHPCKRPSGHRAAELHAARIAAAEDEDRATEILAAHGIAEGQLELGEGQAV